MKTSKEIELEFRADFITLLQKYNAQFVIEYEGDTYSTAMIYCDGIYDSDGNTIRQGTSIVLDSYINPK